MKIRENSGPFVCMEVNRGRATEILIFMRGADNKAELWDQDMARIEPRCWDSCGFY